MMVDMTVGEIEGVSDVRTDHVSGDTIVTYDDAQTNLDAIIDAIRGAGYDAEPAELVRVPTGLPSDTRWGILLTVWATDGTGVLVSGSIGFTAAFVAGLVSFLSPCVLPLIPAYLSFMTGLTNAELSGSSGRRRA